MCIVDFCKRDEGKRMYVLLACYMFDESSTRSMHYWVFSRAVQGFGLTEEKVNYEEARLS